MTTDKSEFALFRRLGELLTRAQLAKRMQSAFGGKRDYYEILGYPEALDIRDYRQAYDRGGIAQRIVNAKPDATWSDGVEILENEDPNPTPWEQSFLDLQSRLNVFSVFHRVDKAAGIGRYAIIFLGAPGSVETPLGKIRPEKLVYLQVFSEEDARIEPLDLERNPENPRFGLPNFYRIKRMSADNKIDQAVHWTRCIHVPAEGILDDVLFGPPRLQAVWNYLLDLIKVAGGGAEAFWKNAAPITQFNLDKDVQPPAPNSDQEKKMVEETDAIIHGMKRALRTRGMELKVHGAQMADIKSPAETLLSLISGTSEIPQRILLGSERGQLASQNDQENWDDRIADRRSQFAFPFIVKPFVDRLIEIGVLAKPATEYFTRWPNIRDLKPGEKVDLALKASKLNAQQGDLVITSEEIRDIYLGLEPLDEADIKEWEEAHQPVDDDVPLEGDEDEDEELAAATARNFQVLRKAAALPRDSSRG